MEKLATHTLEIGREDVVSVAKSINVYIVESDIDYIMRNYDNYTAIGSPHNQEAWSTIVEIMLNELKRESKDEE